MDALGQIPLSMEALTRWASMWAPQKTPHLADAEQLKDLVEEWWKACGVVPRHRYMEVLKRYEELKARLEEAETTVRNLRALLKEKGREQEVKGALDQWEETTRKALETQSDWARAWAETIFGKDSEDSGE